MKRSSIFWGLVLILAAGLLLLRNFGIIADFFSFFWIFLLMLVGIWLIVSAMTRKVQSTGEKMAVPLEGATSARIRMDHGAGRLKLHAGAAPGNLLEGECTPGPILKTSTEGSLLDLRIKSVPGVWTWAPGERRVWDFALSRDIPIILEIDSGASTTDLDLRDLQVTLLDLDTGASTSDITLPAAAGLTQVKIDSGAATLHLHVPEGVAAQIRIDSGMASIHVGDRFPKVSAHLYASPDFASAANRAEITIETGMASVEID